MTKYYVKLNRAVRETSWYAPIVGEIVPVVLKDGSYFVRFSELTDRQYELIKNGQVSKERNSLVERYGSGTVGRAAFDNIMEGPILFDIEELTTQLKNEISKNNTI